MMVLIFIKDFRVLMIYLKILILVLEMDIIRGEEVEVLSFYLEEDLMIFLMMMMRRMMRKMIFLEEDLSLVVWEIYFLVMIVFIVVDIEMIFILKIMGIDFIEMLDI